MRFDKKTVEKVAKIAEEFTEGAFYLEGIGMDLGKGVRYMDGRSSILVWFGPQGARSACAYYIGATLGWSQARAKEISDEDREFLKAAQNGYQRQEKFREWEAVGNSHAQDRAAARAN